MKVAILIFTVLFFVSCSNIKDNSIGEKLSDGKFKLSEQIADSIGLSWNKLLTQENIKSKISELNIIESKDIISKNTYFGIVAKTENDSAKMACKILYKNDKFYFDEANSSITVICYGSKNCYPKLYDSNWICDDGTNIPKCSKNCMKKTIATEE